MKFDITQNLQSLLPWDFDLTYEGVDYPTRRPSLAMLGDLKNLKSLDGAAALNSLAAIFRDAKPDIASWSMEEMQLSVGAYLQYMDEQVRKNSLAVAGLLKPAAAKGTSATLSST